MLFLSKSLWKNLGGRAVARFKKGKGDLFLNLFPRLLRTMRGALVDFGAVSRLSAAAWCGLRLGAVRLGALRRRERRRGAARFCEVLLWTGFCERHSRHDVARLDRARRRRRRKWLRDLCLAQCGA